MSVGIAAQTTDFRVIHPKTTTEYMVKNQQKLVIIIPAYNEERFIGSVVLKSLQFTKNVIVVDDGSRDGTSEVAACAGAIVLQHTQNMGKAAALNTAIGMARDYHPDVVVMIDADGQHLPEELPQVIEPILNKEADIVVGSRYIKNTSNTPLHRRIGHLFINAATGITSGVYVTDSQSGYRAFSPKACGCSLFQSSGFTVESEMQFLAHEYGLTVKEVPITIQYLDQAKRSAVSQGVTVLNGILKLTGQYRPLLFFGVPGFLTLIIGLVWGLVVVQRFMQTSELAAGYAMICILLCITGLIMMTTAFTLHSIRGLLLELFQSYGNRNHES